MVFKNQISGSFYQTENSYTVLVYKKGFEDLYDMLIGVGSWFFDPWTFNPFPLLFTTLILTSPLVLLTVP